MLIGWLLPDEAITGLQLNPSNVEFSATVCTHSLRLADRSSSTEGNTLKLFLIPLNPFVRIISEVYLRDIGFLFSLRHRFCSISVWSLLNLDMFRQPPTEVLNCISYHQQAQMTADIAGASWAYMGSKTVCIVFFFHFYLEENQMLHICDLELKWRLKRRQTRTESCTMAHKLDCYTGFSSVSADDGFSWMFLFLLQSLQRSDYAETGFPKLLDGWFSLALWVLHISLSMCLFVTEKLTAQVQFVNHECTDVCTLNVIQLTEWHSGKFHCLISASMTALVLDERNKLTFVI